MVEYVCNKCFRTFDHKHNYIYHINRKKSCVAIKERISKNLDRKPALKKIISDKIDQIEKLIPDNTPKVINKKKVLNEVLESFNVKNILKPNGEINSLIIYNEDFTKPDCVYCNKNFINNSHRNRHMNSNCDVRKGYIEVIKVLEAELNNIYLENKFLRNKYMSLFGDSYLFPFGTEKFGSLDIKLIGDAVKNPYKGLPDLIEAYHFNQEEKKYNNVRIKNPRGNHMEIYNGTNWVIETKENVIQTLIRTYKDIIDTELDNLHTLVSPHLIRNYNDFSEYVDQYISYLMYDTDLDFLHKKYAKPIYQRIYTAMELMLINVFRKEIFHRLEEEIILRNTKKKDENELVEK